MAVIFDPILGKLRKKDSSSLPTFIPGSVLFADSGGSVSENNSKFFWDVVNNRLGIGTPSPTQALTVAGNIAMLSPNGLTTTTNAELVLEETGDTFGAVRLHLRNRNGLNGALFENLGLDLVDFGFVGTGNSQRNIRYENRGGVNNYGGTPEFQIGNPADPSVTIFDTGFLMRKSTNYVGSDDSSFTVDDGTNSRLGFVKKNGANPAIVAGSAINLSLGHWSTANINGNVSGGSYTENASIDTNGNMAIGTAALATTATNGFLYIPTCAGAPTGTPTAKTGRVPMIYDTTNHKFWIYDGAWKGIVLT